MQQLVFFLILFVSSFTIFAQGKLVFDEMTHDFGKVEEGDLATYEFSFTNEGDAPLALESVKPSCGCTSPFWTKDPVMPGDIGKIKVQYNSRNRPGEFLKSITVKSDAENPLEKIYIKGIVLTTDSSELKEEAHIEVSRKEFVLGTIEKGMVQSRELEISNTGSDTLKILKVGAGCHCISTSMEKEYLIPGEKVRLSISFTPRIVGETEDRLVIQSNDAGQPHIEVVIKATVKESLSGSGVMFNQGGF
jgi:hypothetical protein